MMLRHFIYFPLFIWARHAEWDAYNNDNLVIRYKKPQPIKVFNLPFMFIFME